MMPYYPIFHLSDFAGADTMAQFAAAMAALRSHPGAALWVEPGVYRLTSSLARETQQQVMAGAYGSNPQPVMFRPDFPYTRGIDFQGQQNTALIGLGVTLEIDGFTEPISLRDCSGVTLKGITIRHKRKPYSSGMLHRTAETCSSDTVACVMETDPDCPVCTDTPLNLRTLLYSPQKNQMVKGRFEAAEVLDAHHIAGLLRDTDEDPEGLLCYIAHTYHFRPAILIERAENITLEDVTICNQPGMGVVGNRSENVLLRRLAIVPVPGDHYATNTDGTHFTAMKGLLRYESCTFEGIGDDFANVHSYYQKAIRREGPRVLYLQEKTPDGTHAQTLDYPDVGDMLEMSDSRTLTPVDCFRVVACTPMPDRWMCRVELDRDPPTETENYLFSDITRLPRLEVVGCTASDHFARGVLCKCRNCLIEGNTFRNIHGPGVELAAEAYWYEGVCPANAVIRNNIFDRCGLSWGDAGGIVVKADAPQADSINIEHIIIEDNLIHTPNHTTGIFMRNTRHALIARNTILCGGDPIVISCCEDIRLD